MADRRPDSRAFEAGGVRHTAVVAWRAESGHGLVFFVPDDLRATLQPGRSLADLDEADLGVLLSDAAPLTETETRFRWAGRSWLAQATGPVWAGDQIRSGLGGVLFTSLDGPFERHAVESCPSSMDDDVALGQLLAEVVAG
jgi:hypothetical protein